MKYYKLNLMKHYVSKIPSGTVSTDQPYLPDEPIHIIYLKSKEKIMMVKEEIRGMLNAPRGPKINHTIMPRLEEITKQEFEGRKLK